MLKYLILTCLVTSFVVASPSTISGPLYMADGTTLANGTVLITWPNFSASDGHYVPAGSKNVTVTSGSFSQALEPSTNSSPAFSYKITYRFGSQSPAQCSWTVGTSNASIPAVETCPTAASSVPATNIALSQLSIGGGSNGQCMIISGGVWSAQSCTQSWTINVNDIYNSNTGNVGFGGTPGNFKVDISKSGSSGTWRAYDQTAATGSTVAEIVAGAAQASGAEMFRIRNSSSQIVAGIDSVGAIYTQEGSTGKFKSSLTAANGPNGNDLNLSSDSSICWNSTDNIHTGADDVCFDRNTIGVIEINNGTPGTYRDLNLRNIATSGTVFANGALVANGGGFFVLPLSNVRPTCNSTNRSEFWATQGAAGVADTVAVCAKDSSDVYAWRTIY